ncbi:phenylalanine--tRNA ligase subunit alpha [Candidatus Parcubacteria bacterium]|nr:phenylalanine--tRNA ligase subunit alpha [Candidatus Parcubacteria bacterium]
MEEKLKHLGEQARADLQVVGRASDLEAWRVKYLGRQGALAKFTAGLGTLAEAERRKNGQKVNELKARLVESFEEAKRSLVQERAVHRFDLTQPGKRSARGHLHPLTKMRSEIEHIFETMGFAVADGPEVVSEYDNFDSLNMPPDHPAREMWDTVWVRSAQTVLSDLLEASRLAKPNERSNQTVQSDPANRQAKPELRSTQTVGERLLLRAHTSAFQVRYMQAHTPPFRIIIPGRVFRYEATDATHETQFYQVEGLMVGRDVSAANFRGVMHEFFRRLFRKEVKLRLRPGYFPFTEPSFEMDMACLACGQKGCVVCKQSGWIELMGAGMVHQNVFAAAGYVRGEWQGFAFGMSLERPTMMRYGINDIRLFHSGDLRFLRQF